MAKKPVITLTHHGDFNKTQQYFEKLKNLAGLGQLDKYGRKGVFYLKMAAPKDTGLTSESWKYDIIHDKGGATIVWTNTNVQNGVRIAMILQSGHGTKNGGWVEGIDYINPVLRKIFREMAEDASKEVFGIL